MKLTGKTIFIRGSGMRPGRCAAQTGRTDRSALSNSPFENRPIKLSDTERMCAS